MVSALLCLGGLASLACWRWKLRRSAWLAAVLTSSAYVGFGTGVLTRPLLRRLQASHERLQRPHWGARNVVVLLGAGAVREGDGGIGPSLWAGSRIVEAARLYRQARQQGLACALLISGGDAGGLGRSEAEAYRETLLGLGVAREDLILETGSLNTFQNARSSADLLRRQGADRVVLVSSGLHLRRACVYFEHFGLRPQVSASDVVEARLSWIPLAYNLALADLAGHEYVGLLRYRLYQAMGWNVSGGAAGSA